MVKKYTRKNYLKKELPKYFTHKQSKYGTGTFATIDIPADTIILKEKPYCLNKNVPLDEFYIYKMIDTFLSDKQYIKSFLSLVPKKINSKDLVSSRMSYEDLKYGHQTYLPQLTKAEMILYYMKLKRNMFTFHNSPGICFIATRMNHSCDPNISYTTVGDYLQFKTLKPIHKNDELFDSYIDYRLPKKERQEMLLKRYGFHCKCTKCMNEK